MVVAVQDNVSSRRVQIIPERPHLRSIAVLIPGAEERHMPKRKNALGGIVLQIIAQPHFFARAFVATACVYALAVEGDDVPGAEIEAVVEATGTASRLAEIFQISCRSRSVILVIPWRRPRACLVPAPGLVIAAKVAVAAIGISQVPDRQNGSRNRV